MFLFRRGFLIFCCVFGLRKVLGRVKNDSFRELYLIGGFYWNWRKFGVFIGLKMIS